MLTLNNHSPFPVSDVLAVVALFVVNADDAATFRAFVFSFLLRDEGVDSVVPYELQVLDHAHAVSRAVPSVELLQPIAGEAAALVAEANLVVHQQVAPLFNEGALLVSGYAAGAVCGLDPLAAQVMGVR
jgi:hypothetical protein